VKKYITSVLVEIHLTEIKLGLSDHSGRAVQGVGSGRWYIGVVGLVPT
jgi:hypothetical protein